MQDEMGLDENRKRKLRTMWLNLKRTGDKQRRRKKRACHFHFRKRSDKQDGGMRQKMSLPPSFSNICRHVNTLTPYALTGIRDRLRCAILRRAAKIMVLLSAVQRDSPFPASGPAHPLPMRRFPCPAMCSG